MRRKDREMPQKFADYVIDTCTYATLSTVNADGTPYCIPINIVRDGDSLYFHCAKQGQKIENMRRQPAVCISCVGAVHLLPDEFSTEYESAIVFGQAVEILEDEEKVHALRLLCERYTPSNMQNFQKAVAASLFRTGIWRVHMTSRTGKRKKV